jgi:hypothetical protein
MDLFTATVAASADTWTSRDRATRHPTAKDDRELITAEYLRPIPAQSDYLDNAVRPMPWPVRAAPRKPRGERSTFAAERRLTERRPDQGWAKVLVLAMPPTSPGSMNPPLVRRLPE